MRCDENMATELALSLADAYAPIQEDLAVVERIFDEEIASEFPFVNELCAVVRSYRGKMLRPALVLLMGKATGAVGRDHQVLAAVVELVHMATLAHDDVLDSADERRGRPPVNAIAGNEAAVLLGDYLISHAYHLCSSLKSQHAARRIADTTNIVCEGELLQNYNRGVLDLSEDAYFEIIERKTGALTATACELGAFASGADQAVIAAARLYGLSAGIAFQIVDDVLDLAGDQRQVGKTLGVDLPLGKMTLPAIHCLTSGPAAIAGKFRAAICNDEPFDPAAVRDLLAEAGSLTYAAEVAMQHVQTACRQLDLMAEGEAKTSLIALAEFIPARQG